MKVVGVKELKARLSEYLRLAKAGESVLVTERNEVVAELRAVRRQMPLAAERYEDILEALTTTELESVLTLFPAPGSVPGPDGFEDLSESEVSTVLEDLEG